VLWRRVFAVLAMQGENGTDLARRYFGADADPSQRVMLNQWLLGKRPEPPDMRRRIAGLYGLPPDVFDNDTAWYLRICSESGERVVALH
jgi:hypothetical protein